MESRWNEISHIWKNFSEHQIGYGMLLVLIGVWIGSLLFASDSGYGTNLYTEALGVLVTIAVLDRFARQRELSQLKKRLVREAASRDNSTAVSAVDWMRHEGWLDDDAMLKRANLKYANLENADFGEHASLFAATFVGANLSGAKMPGADSSYCDFQEANLSLLEAPEINLSQSHCLQANLSNANLKKARMIDAVLREVDFSNSDIREANLALVHAPGANFQHSKLVNANLAYANLPDADFSGADLRDANLYKARISNAKFDEQTVLPDARFVEHDKSKQPVFDKYWTPDTDMSRYTDPEHPDFWQPEYEKGLIYPKWWYEYPAYDLSPYEIQ